MKKLYKIGLAALSVCCVASALGAAGAKPRHEFAQDAREVRARDEPPFDDPIHILPELVDAHLLSEASIRVGEKIYMPFSDEVSYRITFGDEFIDLNENLNQIVGVAPGIVQVNAYVPWPHDNVRLVNSVCTLTIKEKAITIKNDDIVNPKTLFGVDGFRFLSSGFKTTTDGTIGLTAGCSLSNNTPLKNGATIRFETSKPQLASALAIASLDDRGPVRYDLSHSTITSRRINPSVINLMKTEQTVSGYLYQGNTSKEMSRHKVAFNKVSTIEVTAKYFMIQITGWTKADYSINAIKLFRD